MRVIIYVAQITYHWQSMAAAAAADVPTPIQSRPGRRSRAGTRGSPARCGGERDGGRDGGGHRWSRCPAHW